MRWAAAYPDVPGLANLLGRFGFASSYTLWVALPEALAGPGRGCHLANAALLFLPIARGLWALSRLAAGRSRWRAGTLFDLLLLFPLLERVWSEQVLVSATPDLPVFVLGIVLTSLLIRIDRSPGRSRRSRSACRRGRLVGRRRRHGQAQLRGVRSRRCGVGVADRHAPSRPSRVREAHLAS